VNLGNLSNFSSAGFRRDGAIKPDITAPGCFMISTLADGAKNIAAGNATITKDGKHVAWSGTSAACPYTAGVVALMLEKNPQLTANQVKKLLCDSADHDLSVTGAVPNGEWGYGKLDAEKAIAAVPAGTAAPVNEPSPVATPAPPASPTPAPVQAAAANFVGTFKGDDMVLILEASDDGFTGKMVRGDKAHIFPITAKAKGNHLDGTASNGTQDFSFSADLDGDLLTLTANNKTFNLSRQISPAVNPFK
jgi:subtilisin family serine protease